MTPPDVFFVTQIGAARSPERERSDDILEYVVEPAARVRDLSVKRADLAPRPGPILDGLLRDLLSAKVVICDLTGRNANVYYELGIAHGLQLKTILLVDTVESLPFDVKDEMMIEIGGPGRISAADAAAASEQLQKQLTIVLADGYLPRTAVSDLLDVGNSYPREIVEAEKIGRTPLYKKKQQYELQVLDLQGETMRTRFSLSYVLVNPSPLQVPYELTLTPVRPITFLSARKGATSYDLSDPGLVTARGLRIPIAMAPRTEEEVELIADVGYRCPDADVFTTYIPATTFVLRVICPYPEVEFIHELLLAAGATRTRIRDGFEIRADQAVLGYQGVKLDWRPRQL